MEEKDLIEKAVLAMQLAYAPYSEFKVGAAIECLSNEIFTGCNIENATYPAGICAERVAMSNALSHGFNNFKRIAVVGGIKGKIEKYCYPCGICRQFISEFCNNDFEIILYNGENIKSVKFKELLPMNFGRENLC